MTPILSFDMDGTLIASEYTDWVWHHGIPKLYAEKRRIPFEEARCWIEQEYGKVGEGAVEWYDIQYWFRVLNLDADWRTLMEGYVDKISVYPEVNPLLDRLKDRYTLVLASNAGREFIDVEMEATGLRSRFDRIFSATSDFREVKKTPRFYQKVCEILKIPPGELVHVGDHYEFDYLVPRAVGIQAYHLDRSARRGGDHTLQDLEDLDAKLKASRRV